MQWRSRNHRVTDTPDDLAGKDCWTRCLPASKRATAPIESVDEGDLNTQRPVGHCPDAIQLAPSYTISLVAGQFQLRQTGVRCLVWGQFLRITASIFFIISRASSSNLEKETCWHSRDDVIALSLGIRFRLLDNHKPQ